ncbi:MAG: PTS sugar transporter subunit IIA [[Ruminococcus] torques]
MTYAEKKRFITEQEAEGIVGRENLVSTEIVEGIAMPHGLIEGSSFLVFALLKEPIIWGENIGKVSCYGMFSAGR